MVALALKNIATQIEMLSVADKIAAIELILQSLKTAETQEKRTDWLDETFALMDKNSVSYGEKKMDTLRIVYKGYVKCSVFSTLISLCICRTLLI